MVRPSALVAACSLLCALAFSLFANAGDGSGQSILDLIAPRSVSFAKDARTRPVSAVVREKNALVADAESGYVYLINRASGSPRRISSVRASADTRIISGDADEWYVLTPATRTVHRLSANGSVLEHARDDEFLLGTTDIAYDLKRKRLLISTRRVVAVDFQRRPVLGPWKHFAAIEMGDWSLISVRALCMSGDKLFVIDSNREVRFLEPDSSVPRQLAESGLTAPAALAGDRYGRVFVAQRNKIHIFDGAEKAGIVDGAGFGIAEIADLRVDGNWLTVTDSGAGKVLAFEIRPPQ